MNLSGASRALSSLQSIGVDTVIRFREALENAGAAHELHIFPGAEHAFMNDRRPEGYQPAVAAESWQLALDFFGRYLKQPIPA